MRGDIALREEQANAIKEILMKLEKKLSVPDLEHMPKPDPARAGRQKIILLALLALLVVASLAYWLTRDDATREQWRKEAAQTIDDATKGTSLEGVGDLLRTPPPPLPSTVISPPTAPGTLAGQNVQGAVPGSGASSGAGDKASLLPNADGAPQALPKVTEDSRVRPQFITDLAAYFVSRFKPGRTSGTLRVSVQEINQRYGIRLPGLAVDDKGGRAALLRYAFHPTMLQGLYGLYADRFLGELDSEAAKKSLSPEQTRQLHMALSGRLVIWAGALEGIVALPDLGQRLENMEKLSQAVMDVNTQMAEAVFALDQLRESGASKTQQATAQLRVDGLSARYRRALDDVAAAQRTLLGAIRQRGGQVMNDEDLLFVAQWVDRRRRQDPQSAASTQSVANILRDMAQRSASASPTAIPPQPTQGLAQ